MGAIAVESLVRMGHWKREQVLSVAREQGWRLIEIETPAGREQAIELESIAPGYRQQIIHTAVCLGEPIYNPVSSELLDRSIHAAREQVRSNKVVSIDAIRLARLGKKDQKERAE